MPNVNIVRTALATIARVSSDMASLFLKFSFACYRPFSSLFLFPPLLSCPPLSLSLFKCIYFSHLFCN